MKKENEHKTLKESSALTPEDFQEFMSAEGEAQWNILLAHARKNSEAVEKERGDK